MAGNTGTLFLTLSQCAARLTALTKPFLNWAGKAERQRISVPTLPLYVHDFEFVKNLHLNIERARAEASRYANFTEFLYPVPSS